MSRIERLVLVGGRGAMGSMLAPWWREHGYDVKCFDRDEEDALQRALPDAHAVVLCVPIDATEAAQNLWVRV